MTSPRTSLYPLQLLLLLIVSCTMGGLRPFTVAACSPAVPTPWFSEQITLSPVPLPDGVTLSAIEKQVAVRNTSPTPLYVLGRPHTMHGEFEPLLVQLPPQFVPIHKIVTDQVFNWRPTYGDQKQVLAPTWEADMYEPNTLVLRVSMFPVYSDGTNSISSSDGVVVLLEPRNRIGDKRPAGVPLPTPQEAHLYLVYNNSLLDVPMTIIYALNINYNPRSVRRAENACSQFGLYITAFGLLPYAILIIPVLFVGLGVWWVWRRSPR